MPPNAGLPSTSILFIDTNKDDRTYFTEGLKRRSPDYRILEAPDGGSGLELYRSERVDCVVLAIELSDCSGFRVLVDLVPIASRPNVAVLMLTKNTQRRLHQLALQNGAYDCFVKSFTTVDDLERAIQRAMSFIGRIPKEERYRPI